VVVSAVAHESGSGTNWTCWRRLTTSAPEGKTDVPREPGHFRSWPFETCRPTLRMSANRVPAQPVDATQALNLSAGVSNCKVSRGRSFS
jgi:hypothetical protein